jgi:hypothetical protein
MTKITKMKLTLTVLGASLAWAALPAVTWAGMAGVRVNHNETLVRDAIGKAKL